MHRPLLVKARLVGLIANKAPRLDSLLEATLAFHHPKADSGYKIDRSRPAPLQGEIPIPLRREWLGDWYVARCSDPICGEAVTETVEHVNKRIGVEQADLLASSSRLVVSTTNSWTKSYRLPMRISLVNEIRWFAVANRRELLCELRRVRSLGKKGSLGYGRVVEWTVDEAKEDLSWFAPTEAGLLLMATLPVGDWVPKGILGARRSFGGATPPYWHPERFGEIVVPC